jgi:PTH1 family peptidyl-tRNA hydrolase
MTWVIVGLGNPDEEYERTRHNAGRIALMQCARVFGFAEWKEDTKANAFVARGMIGRSLAVAVLPNTYMNKSGVAVARFVKSAKAAERLIVVYDDLDLPLGTIKISFDRGSGGHRGVDSIIKSVRTRAFVRVRIGISPEDKDGVAKKPEGEEAVEKFILSEFNAREAPVLKSVSKDVAEAIQRIVSDGREIAMNHYN